MAKNFKVDTGKRAHVVSDDPGHANTPRSAGGLEASRHVDAFSVKIGAVGDDVAHVYPDAVLNALVRGFGLVVRGNFLLQSYRALHGAVDAVEYGQK